MKKTTKRFLSLFLVLVFSLSMVSCGEKKTEKEETTDKEGTPSFSELKLGEDYTDLSADIKFLSHRTDLQDTVFQDYIKQFNELYPNIKITYETTTTYSDDMPTRLTTDDWGDICMLPTSVDKNEFPDLFVSFGDKETLDQTYDFLNDKSYQGQVYGIPSVANVQGIVYNKKVFEAAGITEMPKTPDEFLDALQKIKDNTEAIPMYSNFAAAWTMGAWDAYLGGSATGDPDFMNNKLVHSSNPFSKKDDMTGPYAVYYVLYEAVSRGLIEDDPTTTDWEGCKGMINRGEIGTMVLGSWAVVQMQDAGDNADDIGYMPFPISVGGKQYASAAPDYCYAINSKISTDEQIASMLYIKWLTEKSNFAFDQGGVPIVKGSQLPAVLDAFDGVELVVDNPAPEGEESLFNELNRESEVGINTDNTPDCLILENALNGTATLDEVMDEWNQKWSDAQSSLGIEVTEE
ncbi:ABC transporter substrate-binding protein [Anaeromicropila populeti]|uniref:Carbohydrate ABC transporter substrate-binding protein, CUT1 family (TC 3.A.1.1.-) n=1 Tax=Anaeromicropila populeti TaxID=37658 RepID=A0A1I6LMT8_9FIRM|nr:extracellular solute-binding protein [Anaeromicropila populeti]SFS04600.1 carbohydrate ABC transporter substrate-binding protein, CUT1 family (TC 3.A.1.1.-) [Anaeromicropila populeti]